MKTIFLTISAFLAFSLTSFKSLAQLPPPNTPLWPASGNVSIGLYNSGGSQLQLHGVTDLTLSFPPSELTKLLGNATGGLVTTNPFTIRYGKTSRLNLTNTTTGTIDTDGLLFQQSENNSIIANQEAADLTIGSSGSYTLYDGATGKVWFSMRNNNPASAPRFGKLNLDGVNDNGIFIRTVQAGQYGLSIRSANPTDNAFQTVNGSFAITSRITAGGEFYGSALYINNPLDSKRNFSVNTLGEVYARKLTTTLTDIPDYVFEPTYKLMPISELRSFVTTEKHLPNIPSAKEYEKEGVDLGELNRLLLEKTEELTLYILQLEERIKKLENEKLH